MNRYYPGKPVPTTNSFEEFKELIELKEFKFEDLNNNIRMEKTKSHPFLLLE